LALVSLGEIGRVRPNPWVEGIRSMEIPYSTRNARTDSARAWDNC